MNRFSRALFNTVHYYFIRIQAHIFFLLVYMGNMSERSQDKLGFLS